MSETKEMAKRGEVKGAIGQVPAQPIEVTVIDLLPQLDLDGVTQEIERASRSALEQAKKLGKTIDHF